jgi:hypothetical protein
MGALGAYLRTQLGWRTDLPEKQRNKIAAAARKIIKDGDNHNVAAAEASCAPWAPIEFAHKTEMERLAVLLPVWASFGKDIRGFGPMCLAMVVAEAGDLSNYPTHSTLWKRLGLAVFEGRRQGDPVINTADEWIRHGYNRVRRSQIFNIGDALIKQNGVGRYRTIYLNRKAYELAREPDMRPIKAHRRAQRYMEKMLIRDLWRAWRRS